jgi:rod shape-determining protein MreB and related proteins
MVPTGATLAAWSQPHGLEDVLRKECGMALSKLTRLFKTDLAVDLGTSNTRVFVRGRGIVLEEPSIVATRRSDGGVLAAGHAAKAMLGRTPDSIVAARPIRNGVIGDLDLAQKMLLAFIARVPRRFSTLLRPRITVAVPWGITQVERRAVRDSASEGGARDVCLVDEPLAAAIGAGMTIQEAGGHLIVTIGGGTTQAALISLSGIVHCECVRTGGDDMDQAIAQWVRKQHNLLIGELQAEAIKLALGSARPTGLDRRMEVKGRDAIDGLPKTVVVREDEVTEALRDSVITIVETVRVCLERTPAELAADIVDEGIVLAGGGAVLPGLADVLHGDTGLPVTVAQEPLGCAVIGTGAMLEQVELLRRVASRN